MLQQTRVQTVIPYYERFLERFPDVIALADADEDAVLREWAGLGYYSRARNLHRAAQIIVRDHGAQVPSDPEALGALPGVGRYTLGAVRSIAFDDPAPIVDGNVRRVLARWLAAADLSPREEWSLAEALVPREQPGAFNQALMELGATVCTPRSPLCLTCPVRAHCSAAGADPERYPAPRKRSEPVPVQAVAGLLQRGGSRPGVLLTRRPRSGLLAGLWELPSCESTEVTALLLELERRTGLRCAARESLGELEHGFSHRALTLRVFRLELLDPQQTRIRGASSDEARWFALRELAELGRSRLLQKALAIAGLAD